MDEPLHAYAPVAPGLPGAPGLPRPALRWLGLAALLGAEILLLAEGFDRPPLPADAGWWGALLRLAGLALPASAAVAVALLLFGGDALRASLSAGERPRLRRPLLYAHLATFALLAWLTARVFSPELASGSAPGLRVAAWGATALACTVLLAASAVPLSALGAFVRGGWRALVLGTAIGLAALAAGELSDGPLWAALGGVTLHATASVLAFLGEDVLLRPESQVLGVGTFVVEVGSACSGWQGMGLVGVFVAGYLVLFRSELRFPAALWLLPLGALLVWVANVVRIALLVELGAHVSPDVAVGGFHARAGWLFLCGIALGLVHVARRGRWFAAERERAQEAGFDRDALGHVGPLALLLATGLATGALADGFDRLAPLGALVAVLLAWRWRAAWWSTLRRPSWTAGMIGLLAFGLWIALVPPGRAPAELVAGDVPGGWLVLRALATACAVPLVEELAFRGYVLRRLQSRDASGVPCGRYTTLSFLASSLCFGLLHEAVLAGTLVGMLYALALYRRRAMSDAIVAHATTNALLIAWALGTGDLGHWIGGA